jgi:hypothetical protein
MVSVLLLIGLTDGCPWASAFDRAFAHGLVFFGRQRRRPTLPVGGRQWWDKLNSYGRVHPAFVYRPYKHEAQASESVELACAVCLDVCFRGYRKVWGAALRGLPSPLFRAFSWVARCWAGSCLPSLWYSDACVSMGSKGMSGSKPNLRLFGSGVIASAASQSRSGRRGPGRLGQSKRAPGRH